MIYEAVGEAFEKTYLFDGVDNIKSTRRPQGFAAAKDEITRTAIRKTDNEPITITIMLTGEVDEAGTEMLRFYNTQVRRNMQHMKVRFFRDRMPDV